MGETENCSIKITKDCIKDVLDKIGEMEAYDMISNFGKTLEESIAKKVELAIKETSLDIAKNLLEFLGDAIIAEATGVPIETVQELRAKNTARKIFRNGLFVEEYVIERTGLSLEEVNKIKNEVIYESREEGRKEVSIKVAKNMLKRGDYFSSEFIADCTDLSIEKVYQLKKEMNN